MPPLVTSLHRDSRLVSDTETITLTVSIVTYDSPLSQLETLLESLLGALKASSLAPLRVKPRVVLINNGLTLPSENAASLNAMLASQGIEANILEGHGNIGYGRGQNLAILSGTDKYHLLLNPDLELAPDCLTVGLDYLEAHPGVALVCPSAVDGRGEPQHLCKREPSVFTLFLRGFGPAWLRRRFGPRLADYEMHDLPDDHPSHGIPFASGCFMLCRGERLRAINGFDERYFLYFEDFDLSRRLGDDIVYLPTMKIVHHGGNSARKGLHHITLFLQSARRFFNTYGWRWI